MNHTASQSKPSSSHSKTPDIVSLDSIESTALSIDMAIEILESDEEISSMKVNLGGETVVHISVDDGLLQRLVGHRQLSGIANGLEASPMGSNPANDEDIWVATEVLDLIRTLNSN